MAFLALSMFVGLVAFGAEYFGWGDPHGTLQLALISTFVFGVICGYRAKS
ncbi:hypothetical protein SAMN06297144_2361 [Sphingomonas guangdongensis]|uniref:Uncharacterized protein n=1 Tax=Sphingomonas guangdongensis TaxID=1141890 RepID=A0A285R071_9SPHN|nr:hypothetical protein [Sphingomonas guangdongensis]SOB87234.1 hypothetical protein SAMN06297144_2361 [Sphingomonas guangdongensis]